MSNTSTAAPILQEVGYCLSTFVWREYMAKDVAGSKKFYGDLFGWTYQEMDMGQGHAYHIIQAGNVGVGGLMAAPGPEVPAHWLGYVSVQDVDVKAKAVQAAGGKVLFGPQDIPGYGRFAVIADPQGAVTALFRSVQGDPSLDPAIGHFCWDTLMTTDLDGAKRFYNQILGWVGKPGFEGEPDQIFYNGERMEANAALAPDGVPAHWATYVMVSDIDASREKGVALGGRVIIERLDIPYGSFAVLMDPWGAPICVFQPNDM